MLNNFGCVGTKCLGQQLKDRLTMIGVDQTQGKQTSAL